MNFNFDLSAEDFAIANQLIDVYGGLHAAREKSRQIIARRAAEGKESPKASHDLFVLDSLPVDYMTPKQIEAHRNWKGSGGFEVG